LVECGEKRISDIADCGVKCPENGMSWSCWACVMI
jgi:hypothetical protein